MRIGSGSIVLAAVLSVACSSPKHSAPGNDGSPSGDTDSGNLGGTDAGTQNDDGATSNDDGATSYDDAAGFPPGDFAIKPGAGYDGVLAVDAKGQLVNGAGVVIQLRGANMGGLEGQGVAGYWNSDPWGSMGDIQTGVGGPDWVTYATWKPNAVRIPLNAQAFLGIQAGILDPSKNNGNAAWTGKTINTDSSGTYRATILQAITWARKIGVYVIFDLHYSAPQFTLNGQTAWLGAFGQPLFMDADASGPFWTAPANGGPNKNGGLVSWLQANAKNPATGNINDIVFELFNEPYFGNQPVKLTTLAKAAPPSNEYVMLHGGYCDSYYLNGTPASDGNGIGLPQSYGYVFNQSWTVFGYQQAVDGIRALKATNVILVNGDGYASGQKTISSFYPTDSLDPPQIGTGWHAYAVGDTGYPGNLENTGGTAQALDGPNATIAGTSGIGHAVPVVMTEYGDSNNASGAGVPALDSYVDGMQKWADAKGAGAIIWNWTGPFSYGATNSTTWVEAIADTPANFTASISGTTMTVTNVTGTPLKPGFLITSNDTNELPGTFIVSQSSGTTGGAGTYVVNQTQTLPSTSLTGSMLIPDNGQGITNYNWMRKHAE